MKKGTKSETVKIRGSSGGKRADGGKPRPEANGTAMTDALTAKALDSILAIGYYIFLTRHGKTISMSMKEITSRLALSLLVAAVLTGDPLGTALAQSSGEGQTAGDSITAPPDNREESDAIWRERRAREFELKEYKGKIETDELFAFIQDDEGKTALHREAENGDLDKVRLLLEANVKVNAQDNKGRTPLHLAALSGHAEIVKELLAHGAMNKMVDKEKNSALHLAAMQGGLESIESLLFYGADVNLPNLYGETPLVMAQANGHEAAAAYLEEKGGKEKVVDYTRRDALWRMMLHDLKSPGGLLLIGLVAAVVIVWPMAFIGFILEQVRYRGNYYKTPEDVKKKFPRAITLWTLPLAPLRIYLVYRVGQDAKKKGGASGGPDSV